MSNPAKPTPNLQSFPRNTAPTPKSVTFPKSPVTFAEIRNNDLLPAMTPLFAATGQASPVAMQAADVQTMRLHDVVTALELQRQKLETDALEILAGSGLDVTAWTAVAQAIRAGLPCNLPPASQDALVKKGVLKVQLAFGAVA